jgi:RNA polymerase sigma factor (sigma-70 family)
LNKIEVKYLRILGINSMKPRYSKAEEFEPYFTWKGKRLSWGEQKEMLMELNKNKVGVSMKHYPGEVISGGKASLGYRGLPKRGIQKVEDLANAVREIGALGRYNEFEDGGKIHVRTGASIYLTGKRFKNYHVYAFSSGGRKLVSDLVEMNRPLVVSFVKKHLLRFGGDLDDLMQEGSKGLLRAVERFDPTKNAVLATYASWAIRRAVSGRTNKRKQNEDSILLAEDICYNSDSDGGNSFFDIIPTDNGELVGRMANKDLLRKLSPAVSDREWKILQLYFGRGKTLRQIHDLTGVSIERVRQIKSGAIAKLRDKAVRMGEIES